MSWDLIDDDDDDDDDYKEVKERGRGRRVSPQGLEKMKQSG